MVIARADRSALVFPATPADTLALLGVDAVAMIPLASAGRVRAILSLVAHGEGRFAAPRSLIVEDVARRIELALDRIQLYREAQEANRLKDEFLSTLSHELRTPLNAIFGWARILRRKRLDESTGHAVEVIQRNAEAQIRLVEEVLDVSRIVAGKMAIERDLVDLEATLRAAIDSIRPAAHAKRIIVDERGIETVPPLPGDPHRMQQVFWNLLSNAVKFTGHNGTIALALRNRSDGVEFEITDTGVGIGGDVLPFVFDRFRQADSSTTRIHGGLGLGLAIARHIVELHGGSIRAASPGEGLGATFVVTLPLASGDRGDLAGTAFTSDAPAETAPTSLRGRTVLVVEDDDDARELVVEIMTNAGARVLAAATAAEAMHLSAADRPDLMVADLGLPAEDGYVLLGRFRGIYPHVPAIVLTAYARPADRERALAAGFQEHLIKPVDPGQLVDLVAFLLA